MSTQTMSIESLYANGMGIELPISNVKDSSQAQESYDCSNIIDLQSIENDLNYLNVFSTLDNTHTNDMIKLHNKLNKEYGKHSQALESYLDTRIHSLEEEKKGNKFIEMIKTASSKIASFFIKMGQWVKEKFDKIIDYFIKKFGKEARDFKKLFDLNKDRTVSSSLILKKYNPNRTNASFKDTLKLLQLCLITNKNMKNMKKDGSEKNILNFINSSIDVTNKFISANLKKVVDLKGSTDIVSDVNKAVTSLSVTEFMSKMFSTIKIDEPKEMKISDIFANAAQLDLLYTTFKEVSLDCSKIGSDLKNIGIMIEENMKGAEALLSDENYKKIHDPLQSTNNMIGTLSSKMIRAYNEISTVVVTSFETLLAAPKEKPE